MWFVKNQIEPDLLFLSMELVLVFPVQEETDFIEFFVNDVEILLLNNLAR